MSRNEEILAFIDAKGVTQEQAARHFGVTKNAVAGIWFRACRGVPCASAEPATLLDRMDKLHRRLDEVLAETRGVGVIPNGLKDQDAWTVAASGSGRRAGRARS
jgi:hypothetical protein